MRETEVTEKNERREKKNNIGEYIAWDYSFNYSAHNLIHALPFKLIYTKRQIQRCNWKPSYKHQPSMYSNEKFIWLFNGNFCARFLQFEHDKCETKITKSMKLIWIIWEIISIRSFEYCKTSVVIHDTIFYTFNEMASKTLFCVCVPIKHLVQCLFLWFLSAFNFDGKFSPSKSNQTLITQTFAITTTTTSKQASAFNSQN